jgi:transcriptional regulator with XRE-family HTH domain
MRTSEHETKVTALHRPRRKQLEKHLRVRRADTRDAEVGRRVRSRRLEQKLSQTELADKIGVTFQQVQKYEKGTNRIGAGRLQRIGEALEVPITFFFECGSARAREHVRNAADQWFDPVGQSVPQNPQHQDAQHSGAVGGGGRGG